MKALCIMEDPVIMDIDIMEDAHTALQAMAGTPCAELVETSIGCGKNIKQIAS